MSTPILKKCGTAIAAVLVVLGSLEVIARAIPSRPTVTKSRRYIPADPNLREIRSWFDLSMPFQRGLHDGVLYETNRVGLRSPDIEIEKPPGVYRIALLGDSFVMGEGVLAEDSYAGLLSKELPNVRPGHYEIVNTGLAGLDALHAFKRYRRLGLPYDPDLAIYGFTINDIESPAYRKSVVTTVDAYGVEKSTIALWRLAGAGYVALREAFWPRVGTYAYEVRDNYFHNEAAWNRFAETLDLLKTTNEQRGNCTVVLIHTQLITLNVLHPFRAVHERVAKAARERDFFVVDSLPMHMGANSRELWVAPHDSHPNERGHRILADALIGELRTLPERCWEVRSGRNVAATVAPEKP